MGYILALDQGTTSSRALIFDVHGQIRSTAQKEFRQFFPKSGYVEHDAEEIWSSQYAVAVEAIAKAGLTPADIQTIGIANQRETTIVWDRKTSKPICPAIVWQDRRTDNLCKELQEKGLEPKIREKTGLLLDPYFSGTKIRWILEHVMGAKERALRGELAFGTVDSWLVWKLTQGALHITDVSNASRTLLFNIHTLSWDEELLELLGVHRSLLPEVRDSAAVYGKTGRHLFSSSITIGGIAGDQQAALFGHACFEKGQAKATYGTGCFLLLNTGTKPVLSRNQLVSTVGWKIGKEVVYALEGSVFIAGAAIQWLRDNLKLIQKSADVNALAASVPDTGGVYFVPAFTGLGAPHWDPKARGAIFGLSRGSTGAHLARATLESIAFSVADVLEAMESDAGTRLKEIRVDGGAVASDLLMQFQADLIHAQVLRPKNKEATALGAAMLAGLSAGVWKDQEELHSAWQMDRAFTPAMASSEVLRRRARWSQAVERCKGWE
ncbi:MAG: glycerol kinase GlpK [Chlamydiia bacterium]|nr:glycerol kinase GlpK [Chlamydiia bacterium]